MSWRFFNHSDGSRVRVPAGKIGPASLVREVYRAHLHGIRDTHQLRASIRAGRFTDYGGYPVFWLMADGEALCWACVRENYRKVSTALRHKDRNGWQPVACELNYEDGDLYCSHCSAQIDCAYTVGRL